MSAILEEVPDSEAARAALVRLRQRAIAAGDPAALELARGLSDPAAAVVTAWRRAPGDWGP